MAGVRARGYFKQEESEWALVPRATDTYSTFSSGEWLDCESGQDVKTDDGGYRIKGGNDMYSLALQAAGGKHCAGWAA